VFEVYKTTGTNNTTPPMTREQADAILRNPNLTDSQKEQLRTLYQDGIDANQSYEIANNVVSDIVGIIDSNGIVNTSAILKLSELQNGLGTIQSEDGKTVKISTQIIDKAVNDYYNIEDKQVYESYGIDEQGNFNKGQFFGQALKYTENQKILGTPSPAMKRLKLSVEGNSPIVASNPDDYLKSMMLYSADKQSQGTYGDGDTLRDERVNKAYQYGKSQGWDDDKILGQMRTAKIEANQYNKKLSYQTSLSAMIKSQAKEAEGGIFATESEFHDITLVNAKTYFNSTGNIMTDKTIRSHFEARGVDTITQKHNIIALNKPSRVLLPNGIKDTNKDIVPESISILLNSKQFKLKMGNGNSHEDYNFYNDDNMNIRMVRKGTDERRYIILDAKKLKYIKANEYNIPNDIYDYLKDDSSIFSKASDYLFGEEN
jgi:hypothetical protein